jgi:hypothetical protein
VKAYCSHLEPSTEHQPAPTEKRKRGSLGWREEKGEKRKKERKKEKRKENRKNELFGFLEIVFRNLY